MIDTFPESTCKKIHIKKKYSVSTKNRKLLPDLQISKNNTTNYLKNYIEIVLFFRACTFYFTKIEHVYKNIYYIR